MISYPDDNSLTSLQSVIDQTNISLNGLAGSSSSTQLLSSGTSDILNKRIVIPTNVIHAMPISISPGDSYKFQFNILNNCGSSSLYRIFYNYDSTVANYSYTAALGASGSNDAILYGSIATGSEYILRGEMVLSPIGYMRLYGFAMTTPVTTAFNVFAHTYNTRVTNIFSITIMSSADNAISTGSSFRIGG